MSTAPRASTRRPAAENKANGKPVLFDLDAYQAEAQREPFTFSLGGQRFSLAHMDDLDWHTGVTETGEVVNPTGNKLLRAAFGDQWDRFGKLKLSGDGYHELLTRYFRHCGVNLGEEDASPDS